MTTYRWQDVVDANGDFNVSPELWVSLNAAMTQDQIIELFQDAVDAVSMPFPFRRITLEQATEDFKKLRYLNTKDMEEPGPWLTGYDYKYKQMPLAVGKDNTGLLSSNYFHQRHRYNCDNNTRNAAFRAWGTRKTRREIFKPLWTMEMTQVTPREVRSCGALRTYVAAQFRPSVAKYIYDRFGGGRVLDFSAGWGDRLSAALATNSVTHYTGIDPNTNLHAGYAAQVEAYNRSMNSEFLDWFAADTFEPKSVKLIHSPAEDVALDGEYDLVFTSPPYFDKEFYSKEATQSYVRYKTIDGWLKGFMYPVLTKVWDHLAVGGHLCVNIVDIKNFNPTCRVAICDPMNDYVGGLTGAAYQGAIGMKMSVRPNLDAEAFCEPMWVWKKQ